MGEKLAPKLIVTVGGITFENAPEPADLGQPISLEICHRDSEQTRLTLKCKDYALDTDNPFPVYNTLPNPRRSELIPVVAFIGWEDEEMVRAFEGVLAKKRASFQLSQTELIAIHYALKLKKRGRVDTKKNITLRDFITKKFAEEGIKAQFHKSVVGDPALETPLEAILQPGDTAWDVVKRFLRASGFIWNTIKADVVVIRRDKSDGAQFTFRRGDENIISLNPSCEQKFDEKSGRRKGHAHEVKPGRRWSRLFEFTDDTSRAVTSVGPQLPVEDKSHKVPLHKAAHRGKAKRHEIEGDELSLTVRLQPEMRNEERVIISGFGREIDGEYQTRSVTHRLGPPPQATEIEAWRP